MRLTVPLTTDPNTTARGSIYWQQDSQGNRSDMYGEPPGPYGVDARQANARQNTHSGDGSNTVVPLDPATGNSNDRALVEYDYWGHPTSVAIKSGASDGVTYSMGYDALGRLIEQRDSNNTPKKSPLLHLQVAMR